MKKLLPTLATALLLTACAQTSSQSPPQSPTATSSESPTQPPSEKLTTHKLQIINSPSTYLWFEPEWFHNVDGSFAYWPGPDSSKPTGKWGIAGPGISAEWTQGGESEWNSMGAPAAESSASCSRDFSVPKSGRYKIWVRYVDHRKQSEPFTLQLSQPNRKPLTFPLGSSDTLPPGDEYQLWWGFSFAWTSVEADLTAGPATLSLIIDQPGQAWRQLDAVLLTDNLSYTPIHREKPPFNYFSAFASMPTPPAFPRGNPSALPLASTWAIAPSASNANLKPFTMWTPLSNDPEFWKSKSPAQLTTFDVIADGAAEPAIKKEFLKTFARPDAPVLSYPNYVPGAYLGYAPKFTPDSPLYQWLLASKSPFYMLTNYANPVYDDTTGPALYNALSGPLAGQFLGFIHGESIGSLGISIPPGKLADNRRDHIDAWGKALVASQAKAWSKMFKTPVPESFFSKSIPCLSVDSISLAHEFHHLGAKTVGYEVDSTNAHVPMRIAFERGAARQYNGAWLTYASSNFGDSCNTFAQQPIGQRGAGAWWHSRYAITDGVSASWYRKFYYMNYMAGASAIFWEQGLANQWLKPGPGNHPVQLSPFGRATQDFQDFTLRLPDRGTPHTPIAFLLSHGHSYDPVSYACKMLHVWEENQYDRELRELFNVAWFPFPITQGQPQAPDAQSMPAGRYGDIFDVLVDRPDRAQALLSYPIVWAAGDVNLQPLLPTLTSYVQQGGTLVLNVNALRQSSSQFVSAFAGVHQTNTFAQCDSWAPINPDGSRSEPRPAMPFQVDTAQLGPQTTILASASLGKETKPILTRRTLGKGAIIVSLIPGNMASDERAHPLLPWLMDNLTQDLIPIQVLTPQGHRLTGQAGYSFNKTPNGFIITLYNPHGIDKTTSGIARLDRSQSTTLLLRSSSPIKSATEYTLPQSLPIPTSNPKELTITIPPGDLRVISITTQ
jgi:hypothetical protein